MYTRCPTCSTCFRVTERHLAIAKGKVRCGQCQLVFNATEHSIDDLPVSDITSVTQPKPTASSTLATNLDAKKPPKSAPIKKVAPAPIAPTAKEKQAAETKINPVKKSLAEKNSVKASPVFDANTTMITDLSNLNESEIEDINLDASSIKQNDGNESADNLFDNNFDINAAIDELTQTSTAEQKDTFIADNEKTPPVEKNNKDDVFHTDAYDATNASSVADILDEMEGQLSLNIPEPESNEINDKYDANNEFDFLELNDESNNQRKEQVKSESSKDNNVDEFEFIELDDEDDEPDELKAQTIQEESFDVELDNERIEIENDINEDKLFKQDGFDDDDIEESALIKEPSFENDELQNSDELDVPIQLRNNIKHLESSSQRNWHSLLKVLFTIILLILSFSQLALFRSHDLVKQIPSSRPLLVTFCEAIGCHYSGPQDIKQIQLVSRDVRLHPKEKKALLISAAMINNAHFAQPYPNIHIRLSDISGNVIAERIFNSKTYMGKLSTPFLLMKPKTPVHINFEVVDPGSDAVNFEFNFL